MKVRILFLVLGVCSGMMGARAAAVSEAEIRATAVGYIACQGGRLLDGSVGGRAIDRMYPITEVIDGETVTLAYGVAFAPEGWVIVTADDRFDPVLGFSAEGRFRPEILADRTSAPYAFIVGPLVETYRQLQTRPKRQLTAAGAAPAAGSVDGLVASAKTRRSRYLDRGEQLEGKRPLAIEAVDPLRSVSDPRVDRLLATTWAQHGHGEEYYLERFYCHGAVSGCNQTMMGQIMYYHKWPQDGIGRIHNKGGVIYRNEGGTDTKVDCFSAWSYPITLFDGHDDPQNPAKTVYDDVWCRGGDGSGGPYQWDRMYVSGSSSSTSQQEALGALMFDIGVASGAKYTVTIAQLGVTELEIGSTSATTWPEVMMKVFDYANVRATPIGLYGSSGITGELVPGGGAALTNSLHCNLDAKLPCMLNVIGLTSMGGHGVIADGYGFQDSVPYYRINFGYGGDHDGYYQWNAMYTYGTAWVYFNIYPQATGEIVSGRVLKPNGDPLSGATVTVSCPATNIVCTSDARGIWAAVGVPSNASVTVTPSASGYAFTARNVTVGKSSQTYCQPVQADCGNVWGVDFTGVVDAGGGDDDGEIVRPEDAPVDEEGAIDAMTWNTLFPTAKTFTDTATSFTLPYRQHSPTAADGVRYPLVVFLHGAGEVGTDNEKQVKTENDVIPITRYAMKHGDAFVLAPQCPGASGSDYSLTWSGANWNNCPMTRLDTPTKPMAALVRLITDFVAENPVDPTRIYVTGLSMGGFGTWDLASRMSDTFAAVMPCCGGADPDAASLYGDGMAIRFFHGSSDNVVSPNFSRGMDTALTTAGIEHDYIEYSGVNHVDCWRKAYVDTDLNLEWLFGHIKGEEYVAPDHGDTTENAPLSTIANGGWLGWKLDKNESFIVNRGTKVWAYAQNYSCRQGRSGANLVVNEVEFTKSGGFASDDTGIKNHITCDKTFGYGRDNFGVEDLSDGTSDFARMIKTGWEATGDQGPSQTYTLHGLAAGKTYLVQFVYHCASKDRAMLSVIAPDGTTGTRVNGWDANGQNLDENWRYGGSLVGVFTASGSDQTLVITYSKTANYILNAVQLREVTAAELTDGPAIEYGTPTIGSVTPSVNGTTATLTLANVASGENGGCYQVWLAYAEDGTTLGNETAALISQQSASCAVEIKNLTAGKKYNYSLYVKNEGNVISVKKAGSFTVPGGSDPDPVDPPVVPGGSYAATGAEEIIDGDHVVYVWNDPTKSGTLTLSGPVTVDYLVVGGGGAGGFCRGGGGGGGGVVYKTAQTLGAGTYTVTVGAGGTPDTWEARSGDSCYKYSGASTEGTDGGGSSIASGAATVCEALGGGGGGTFITGQDSAFAGYGSSGAGRTGANAGGSANKQPSVTAYEGGFAGGAAWSGGDAASGGGGGAGAVGVAATSNSVSGDGGAGFSCAITGEDVVYGGGGGAGVYSGTAGAGGSGGGGNGGKGDGGGANAGMSAGVDGLGGGGGGASGGGNKWKACGGAKGGSGVVIIRLPLVTGDEDDPDGSGDWTAIPMTSNGSVFSTDGDLVFAFSRDRGDPGTTYENSSTPVTFNYINSLTDVVTKYHPWQHGGAAIDGPYGNGLQPADYLAASPALSGANGNCGDEGLGSDMSGFGSMLGCMWTGPSLSGTDGKATFTFKRLTPGRKYMVEFFIHDHDQAKSITSPDGKATIYYGGDGWRYGGVLRGTFTAVAATQDVVLTYSDPGSYGMGAIQLREIGTVTPPPAHEHEWSAWVTNTPPTATSPGERTRTCVAEGCTVPPATETEVVPATGGGEDPDDPVVPPQDGPGSIAEAAAVLAPGYWYAAPLTGDPADIVTNGTMATTTVAGKGNKSLSGAKSWGQVNGVDFGGSWSGDGGMTSSPHGVSQGKDFGTAATCGVEGQYGQFLKNAFDSGSNDGPCTFAFSGLDPAKTYLVQYVIHSTDTGHTADVMGLNGLKSIRLGATDPSDDWYYGGTLIHVFRPAQDGTYSLVIDYRKNGAAANAIVNAFQVREIEEREAPAATNGWTSKPMTLAGNGNGAAFSEEGTQVFAFMPDDADAGTTATNLYACNIRVNLLNSLTDTVSYLHDATQKEWNWQNDRSHPWDGVFNDGRQPVDFMTVVPSLSRNAGCETVSGASDEFNCMLKRAFINYDGATTMTVTFKNLTAGSSYVAELYVHHGFNGDKKYVIAPDGVTKACFGGEGDWLYGGILSGRFVAKSTQESFTFTYSASNALQINVIQLRQLGDVPDEPAIELVVPEFAADGSALGFTGAAGTAGAKFSMTISNPVKDAWYTVFTAEKLTDTFKAAKDSERFDGGDTTLTLTVDADKPSLFAKIVISTAPYKSGSEL